jgi:hypothetical protein
MHPGPISYSINYNLLRLALDTSVKRRIRDEHEYEG